MRTTTGRPHNEANLEALRASANLRGAARHGARTAPPCGSHASLRSVLAAACSWPAIATGAVLTVGSSPAVAEGTIGSHAVNLTQPAFRSAVRRGWSGISLATPDATGPGFELPHRAD